ncbi:MAG: sulfatase-like hydrolase/transferase [Bacteroidales bacterium]|nr:sulfatase-like hydrolase/transferase [Bacteroidales bacterium]
MRQKGDNIYVYIINKVLLTFGVLLSTQVLFYVANTRIFHVDGLNEWLGIAWGNVVFGFATVTAFLLPFLVVMIVPTKLRYKKWYHVVSEVLYIVPTLAIIIPNCCDSAYYQFTYRLLSSEIFSYLGISGQMGALAPHFAVDYWYTWVLGLVIAILFLVINGRIRLVQQRSFVDHSTADIVLSVVMAAVVFVMLRGGFGSFIQPDDASRYCQPKNAALVGNDAYNILCTIGQPDLRNIDYMPENEARELFEPVFTPAKHYVHDSLNPAPRPNIVILVLEGFAQEYMGCYNGGALPSYTPFLDSLAQYATLYDGRSNGKKSIEGIAAITSAVPNLMTRPFLETANGTNYSVGIPNLLKPYGYKSGFFHGTYNGVMNFDKYCQHVGFDEYIGKDEYEADPHTGNGDYDGAWGIFDGPFLDYTVRKLNNYRQPFFAEIFTISSHHPYELPEGFDGKFAEGPHPILRCVGYADYAVRRFFEQAQRSPWYENTLFVIVGDHSGPNITPQYNDYEGWYSIPMIFFTPGNPQGKVSQRIMQQIDIMPTLLDMLEIDTRCICYGTSAIRNSRTGRQIAYGNGYYLMVGNSADDPSTHEITTLGGGKESGTTRNIATLKSIIQQYNKQFAL